MLDATSDVFQLAHQLSQMASSLEEAEQRLAEAQAQREAILAEVQVRIDQKEALTRYVTALQARLRELRGDEGQEERDCRTRIRALGEEIAWLERQKGALDGLTAQGADEIRRWLRAHERGYGFVVAEGVNHAH